MARGDREFLRSYAQGQPSRQPDESVEDYARRVGADPGPADTPTEPEQPKAEEKPEEKPKAGEQPEKKGGTPFGKTKQGKLANVATDKVEGLRDRIAALPTPGGIGALLLILLLFVFIIVPVAAGYTRLQLLWLTILGRTSLQQSAGQPSAADTSGQSNGSGGQQTTAGNGAYKVIGTATVRVPTTPPTSPFPTLPGHSAPILPGQR